VLRVADGAAVSIAYGKGEPQPVATRSQVELLATNLNELTVLLQLTRNEAANRNTRLEEVTATVTGLSGGMTPPPPNLVSIRSPSYHPFSVSPHSPPPPPSLAMSGPAAITELNEEVDALASAVSGYQKCFTAGKLPGGNECKAVYSVGFTPLSP
jgi:hypothetical protein